MNSNTALVWFSRDLRLEDNPALNYAEARHDVVIPIFIWALALDQALRNKASRLILLRAGASLQALLGLLQETKAVAAYWNKRYESAARRRDWDLAEALRRDTATLASMLHTVSVAGAIHDFPEEVVFVVATVLGKRYDAFSAGRDIGVGTYWVC